jgi:hypothetical protein
MLCGLTDIVPSGNVELRSGPPFGLNCPALSKVRTSQRQDGAAIDPDACTVSDPWDGKYGTVFAQASTIQDWPSRVRAFKDISMRIGKANEDMIQSCDAVLRVMDGAELGSGTASKIWSWRGHRKEMLWPAHRFQGLRRL